MKWEHWKFKTKSDEVGNVTESTYYNADGEVTRKFKTKYGEFDNLKNWIVRTKYMDDKLKSITEREIEYYE